MGTPGVPWVKDNATIMAAIKKYKGKITHIAKDPTINCHIQTIRCKIHSDPELKQMLDDYRNHWVEDTLDQAEDVIKKVMEKVDDKPEAALKSAMFALNNMGKNRGYSAPEERASNSNPQVIVVDYSKSNTNSIPVRAEELPVTGSTST